MTTLVLGLPRDPRKKPRTKHAAAALAGLLCLPLLACSTSDGSTSGGGGQGGEGGGPPDVEPGDSSILVGSFQVRLVAPVAATENTPATPGSTAVLGKVYDGPTLSQIIWEEAAKEGACKLSTPRVPFCNTPCGGSAACVEDDTCKDYPLAHSAGTITVKGLHTEAGENGFSMDPVVNAYQPPANVKLPYPAFAEGDVITFQASGDYFSAFALEATGIAPLALAGDKLTLESGKPVSLAWTPPTKAGSSRVYVKLDISHHGGTKGMIECDAEDTGSLEISAALLTKLLDLGVAGYPSIVVARKSTGSTTIKEGRIDLVLTSSIEEAVQIPGLTSCTSDVDCPSGQICQADLTCK
ncbi:hypothetical protein [Polyangium sp. 6x1]|uniref:hypothetical protein n=1 Tax=Polyangium sp. 6x1 TaxID=3042689 RepID=UPI0024832B37|nr:hypothetical protein [Polyangium sp. 6x1]MDI1451610.1 hypothetical protein [Polyangium sp. 6x1]